jgi:predicted chitinase
VAITAIGGINNNMYATHDGNAYKNTGDGWQQAGERRVEQRGQAKRVQQ